MMLKFFIFIFMKKNKSLTMVYTVGIVVIAPHVVYLCKPERYVINLESG